MNDETQKLPAIEGGPIRETADLPRQVFGFARMLRRVAKECSFKPLAEYVFVPAKPPTDFALESLQDLAARLATEDVQVAKAILEEAQAIYQEPQDRIESAERRATALQGAVAIAASVVVAGGGLLLDPAKLPDREWRVVFAAGLLVFVLCLTGCAMRALGVTGRAFRFYEPGPQRIADRAGMSAEEALVHRAAELLRSSDVANQVARVKVGLLRSAAWWFRIAILAVAALGLLMLVYAIAVTPGATERDLPARPTPTPAATSPGATSTATPAATPTAAPSESAESAGASARRRK